MLGVWGSHVLVQKEKFPALLGNLAEILSMLTAMLKLGGLFAHLAQVPFRERIIFFSVNIRQTRWIL